MKKARKKAVSPTPPGVVRLGDVLPQLIARYGIQRRRNVEQIDASWKTAVGPPFDAVSRVVGLSRGTLEISVPHTAFVQELSFRQKELLHAMQTALPEETIKKIKFSV